MKTNASLQQNIQRSGRLNHVRFLSFVALAITAAAPAFATTDTYTGPDAGSWNTAANWTNTASAHLVPIIGDDAVIDSSATITSVNFNESYTSTGLDSLTLDSSGHPSITFKQITASAMIAATETIGLAGGQSIYTQSAGTNVVNNTLTLGSGAGSSGNYALSGNSSVTLTVNSLEAVGGAGVGNFTQSGGVHILNGDMQIGQSVTGNGTYSLSAGSLNENTNLAVGQAGTGNFNQTGGSAAINLGLFVGSAAGSTGTYTLSTGVLTAGSAASAFTAGEFIGNTGTGSFIQSGGSNTVGATGVNQTLIIGDAAVSVGTYAMSNAASTLIVNGDEAIGVSATGATTNGNISQYGGTFTQTAGNHTVTLLLEMGDIAGSTASFFLSGGNLSVGTGGTAFTTGEIIGDSGTGVFAQTAGANTIGTPSANQDLFLGSAASGLGTYSMSNSAATLIVNGNEFVGNTSIGIISNGSILQTGGTFVQSAGNHTVTASLVLARNAGSSGSFDFSGGSLTVANTGSAFTASENIGEGGTALFSQSGGTHMVGTAAANQTLYIGISASSNGDYAMSNAASTLAVNGNLVLAKSADSVGSFTQSGGNITVTNNEQIGLGGNGTFIQSGGNHTIGNSTAADSLDIGASASAVGNYTINNFLAVLNVAQNCYLGGSSTTMGGAGALNISAGNVTINGTLFLLTTASAVNLSGGVLNVGSINTEGQPSTFHWTGGQLNLQNGFTLDSSFALGNTLNIQSNMGLTITSAQPITNNGSITLGGGAISSGNFTNNTSLAGNGSLSLAGGFTNTGQITVSGGNLLFSLTGFAFGNSGTVTLASGFQMQISGANLFNDGSINLAGGTLISLSGGEFLQNGSDGVVVGPGNINNLVFANAGTLVVPDGTTKVGSFINSGVIEMAGAAAQLGSGGNITNNAIIEGFGKISDNVTNNGTLQPLGGTLNISGTLSNPAAGLIAVAGGTNLLVSSGLASNAGTLSLTGGTFDNGNQPLNNTGQITGYGTFRTGGTGLTNNNAITFTGGTSTINGPVINAAGKTIIAKNDPAIFTGNVTNNGTIIVTNTTITFTGNYTGNAYISDPSTNIFQSNITVTGSMTGGASDQFLLNGGAFTNTGNFTNGGLLQSADNTTNSNIFTQTGAQTWSAGTTFTNTAGTATFGTDTGSATSSPLSIFVTGGVVTFNSDQHLNSLNIQSGNVSILTGITKTNALTFAGSTNNWTGTLDLTSNKLIVEDTSATRAADIAQLKNQATTNNIQSSTAAAFNVAAGKIEKVVAVVDNSVRLATFPSGSTNFGGVNNVDTNSILITAAFKGDANLDGVVDIQDLTVVANHWQQAVTDWSQGDFDNSNFVDIQDLTAVANNWQASVGSGGGSGEQSFSQALALIGPFSPSTPTPEPASLSFLAFGTFLLATRRRTKSA